MKSQAQVPDRYRHMHRGTGVPSQDAGTGTARAHPFGNDNDTLPNESDNESVVSDDGDVPDSCLHTSLGPAAGVAHQGAHARQPPLQQAEQDTIDEAVTMTALLQGLQRYYKLGQTAAAASSSSSSSASSSTAIPARGPKAKKAKTGVAATTAEADAASSMNLTRSRGRRRRR